MSEGTRFYVYVDFRADDSEPFYVGKGRLRRTRDFKQRNKLWHDIVSKHGVVRKIVFETLDEQLALDEEIRLIFEFKTRDYLGGANKDDGGQGPSGYRHTKPTKEVLGALSRNRLRTPEERLKASVKFVKMWQENRDRLMKTHIRGETHHKARLSEIDVINLRTAYDQLDKSKRGTISAFYRHWASVHGVTGEALFNAVHRITWAHLP